MNEYGTVPLVGGPLDGEQVSELFLLCESISKTRRLTGEEKQSVAEAVCNGQEPSMLDLPYYVYVRLGRMFVFSHEMTREEIELKLHCDPTPAVGGGEGI